MTLVTVLCLILSGAWIYAQGIARTGNEKGEGIPIEIKKGASVSTPDKGSSIQATIDGHYLSVVFLENLGNVNIEIVRIPSSDEIIESTPTPNGVVFYIAATGNYTITFALPTGDEYYGEFTVTN